MIPDVVAHSQHEPPEPRSRVSTLTIWTVAGLVTIWVIQELAATFRIGPQPDPALTLMISGIVGALATTALKR